VLVLWAISATPSKNTVLKLFPMKEILDETKLVLFIFYCLFICSCTYIVWAISPPCPQSRPSPYDPPRFQAEPCSALFSSFVEDKTLRDNKKDIAFLPA
jgi:hypothetical protein